MEGRHVEVVDGTLQLTVVYCFNPRNVNLGNENLHQTLINTKKGLKEEHTVIGDVLFAINSARVVNLYRLRQVLGQKTGEKQSLGLERGFSWTWESAQACACYEFSPIHTVTI